MGSWSSDPGTCKSVRIFWDTPGSAHKEGDKTADFTFFWKTSEVAAATEVPHWGEEREFCCIYSISQVCAKLKRSFSCFDHGFHPGFFQGCPDPLWSRSCPVLGSGWGRLPRSSVDCQQWMIVSGSDSLGLSTGKAGWESPETYRTAASFSSTSSTSGKLLVTINLATPIQAGRCGRN